MRSKKYSTLIRMPVNSLSGYGSWSRQILYTILNSPLADRFSIHIWPVMWGQTPNTALEESNPINDAIRPYLTKPKLETQPDIFITQTIPTEFERMGRILNVGITAACESDRISLNWINKINDTMDIVMAISNFTADIISNTGYVKRQQGSNEVIEEIKVRKPVGTWTPVTDVSIYRPGIRSKLNLNLSTRKNFLFVGHWLKGEYGKDRKNVGVLIRTFLQTFLGVSDVGLIVKTSGASFSPVDFEEIQKKINVIKGLIHNPEKKQLPKIYLLHGDLTDKEMAQLYNHPSIISYVAVHHGEGWGMPICDAMACNLATIQVPWSGNADFVIQDGFMPVPYTLQDIPDDCLWDDIFIKSAKWACVDESILSRAMIWAYENPSEVKKIGVKGGENIRNNFTMHNLQLKTDMVLDSFIKSIESRIVDPNKIPFKEI